MMDFEQEEIFHRARLRRARIAALRRRRVISELQRQIEFETMWADPRRRVAFDHLRRAAGLVVSGLKFCRYLPRVPNRRR